MATNEIGNISEMDNWETSEQKSFSHRMFSGIARFAQKKPLGFV
jgi:hypothetical protein